MHYDLKQKFQSWPGFHSNTFAIGKKWSVEISGFTRTGFIQLVAREDVDKLKANVLMHQRIGVR